MTQLPDVSVVTVEAQLEHPVVQVPQLDQGKRQQLERYQLRYFKNHH